MRRLLFTVYCCLGTFVAQGQKLDSLHADSSKKVKTIQLNAIMIRGHKPVIEQRVDGIVFNLESLPPVAGSDASDVLRTVPMVSVDGSGTLMVRGSSNVKVLIDGKPSDIYAPSVPEALRTLRGEQIVKVEVITDPSAKYDAQGTDAVINIITRKLKPNTTNANVGGMLANRGENIEGDIHHQQGAWQVHSDAVWQGYRNKNGSVLLRNAEGTALRQETETQQTGHYVYGGVNLIYSLDTLNTLNAGYRIQYFGSKTGSVSNAYDTAFLFTRTRTTPVDGNNHTVNVGFNGQSGNKKSEYSVLGLYSAQHTNTNYTLEQTTPATALYEETFAGTALTRDITGQADYTYSFSTDSKWESGIKLSNKRVQNDNEYTPDAGRSAMFRYQNSIYAAYTSLTHRLGHFGFGAGLRYENTRLDATFKNTVSAVQQFDNLVPHLLVQFTLPKDASLKLSYTQKISRPFVSFLDPTVITSDSLTLQHGNPALKPEITNRYQFSYSVNDPKLFRDLTFFFDDNRNAIDNINTPLPNGRLESTWKNIGTDQQLGGALTLNWKPVSALMLGSTFTERYVSLTSPSLGIRNNGLTQQLTVNANYKMPHGYSLDFYGYFAGNGINLQGYNQGWKFYNMTLNKKFKNERLNLSLRSEVFFTRYTYHNDVITTSTYSQRQITRYQNQNIRVSISYKLGKTEVKTPQMRSVEQ